MASPYSGTGPFLPDFSHARFLLEESDNDRLKSRPVKAIKTIVKGHSFRIRNRCNGCSESSRCLGACQ
jgi:hypothetical protein